jgi:hypothetical protein
MRRPVGTPDPTAFVGACTLAGASPTPRNPSARHQRRNSDALRTPGDRSSAAFRSARGIRARRCDRGHSSRLVPDRLLVDPDNRLALPAPSHCCFRLGRAYRRDPQPARCGDRSRVLCIDPRRLSPFSLDCRPLAPTTEVLEARLWRQAARPACVPPSCVSGIDVAVKS